jgi:NitT/TauT family transport system ATP-binding protein
VAYALEIDDVSHWFGTNKVLNGINLKITDGQIVALVGPSGCGKSTLLRAILGTHPPKAGKILADGMEITRPSRAVGIVYQHYTLYDFLTARENVALGPKLDQTTLLFRLLQFPKWREIRAQQLRQADEFLCEVGLEDARNRYPNELSGGMRQRVAIAQAMVMRPNILLLDEPFGALDESTRTELQMMLLRFYQENLKAKFAGTDPPYTILIVTHELNEALYVADRVVGLSQYHKDGKNGATIVYDRACPIFHPDDARDFGRFIDQREELRQAVFDEEENKQHQQFVTFWDELQKSQTSSEP